MPKMTIGQLGVIVFAICLSTQVLSQNTTTPMSTMNATMPTDANSTSSNTTSSNTTDPIGAGVSLHAGAFSFLIPFITSATLLQRNC